MGAQGSHKGESHAELFDDPNPKLSNDLDCNAKNLVLDITTGTKIGTATNQKLSFHGVTPIVQEPANADTSGLTLANLEIEVNQLKQLLRNYGLMA